MTTLPDGRHIIPVSNSDSKCLLENWVEERATESFDHEALKLRNGTIGITQILKNGHRGLLTTTTKAESKDLTAPPDAYRHCYSGPGIKAKGSRTEMMQQMFLQKVLSDIEREENPPPDPHDSRSHFIEEDLTPIQPAPTGAFDYRTEQSVTFWSQHRDKAHGVTQTKPTFDSAFRKNSAFSRPIHETWDPDQTKPHDHDHYPNM